MTNPDEKLNLDDIEQRCNAATDGPWRYNSYSAIGVTDANVAWVPVVAGDTATDQGKMDAYFIAHARTDIPALIAEVEALRDQAETACGIINPHEPMNEIKAAAQRITNRRLVASGPNPPNENTVWMDNISSGDAIKVADAYLAEHPEDDDEPAGERS